jgi:predicted glutamine amidotransferase
MNGDTDSECFFHLILAFLYDLRRLDEPGLEPKHVADAMTKAMFMVDELESDAGSSKRSPFLALMSNGYALLALRRSPKGLAYMTYEAPGRGEVRPRAVLVACERTHRGSSWQELPERSILQVRRDLSVEVTEF